MKKDEVLELVKVLEESSLTEIKIEDNEGKVTLKKEGVPVAMAPVAPSVAQPVASAPTPDAGASAPSASSGNDLITSPIVGTFYRSPSPDSPPFVEEGKTVNTGEGICIIEAMKIMNQLEAEFPCTVVKILVNDGDMVEHGTPLFEVKRG